ncbi:MAG: rhodanese-like domain-containing protein [Microbispora sp.]|nr:rhodanese-like domain-containing protein [Microbispora sp.]
MSKLVSIIRAAFAKGQLRELSVDEVADGLVKSGFHVFDVNPHARWAMGHVPGAVNLDPADFTAADLPAERDATLVFYCSDPSCGASRFAARRAQQMGYAHVFVMPAGIRGWLKAGKPVEQGR